MSTWQPLDVPPNPTDDDTPDNETEPEPEPAPAQPITRWVPPWVIR
jgi:hypothetical protein